MLTIQDCIALSELTEEEILAIADHEHIPEMLAVELGNYLVHTEDGEVRIGRMIRDDIEHAHRIGDYARAGMLRLCLQHYLEKHPHGIDFPTDQRRG